MDQNPGTESFLAFNEHREVIMIKEERSRELSKGGARLLIRLGIGLAYVAIIFMPDSTGSEGALTFPYNVVYMGFLLVLFIYPQIVWQLVTWPMKLMGAERKDWVPKWVDCRLMVPTVLEFDHSAAVPTLRWAWRRDKAHVLESTPIESPNTTQAPPDQGFGSGRFELKEGSSAFDLYRNPRTDAVLLEIRRTDTGQRLVLQLDDAGWLDETSLQALPDLDLSGPTLDRHDQADFFHTLAKSADVQGLTLPRPLTQFREATASKAEVGVAEVVEAQ